MHHHLVPQKKSLSPRSGVPRTFLPHPFTCPQEPGQPGGARSDCPQGSRQRRASPRPCTCGRSLGRRNWGATYCSDSAILARERMRRRRAATARSCQAVPLPRPDAGVSVDVSGCVCVIGERTLAELRLCNGRAGRVVQYVSGVRVYIGIYRGSLDARVYTIIYTYACAAGYVEGHHLRAVWNMDFARRPRLPGCNCLFVSFGLFMG